MATTGVNFIEVTTTSLEGSAVLTAPYLSTAGPKEAGMQSQGTQPIGGTGNLVAAGAIVLDKVGVDLSLLSLPVTGVPQQVPTTYGTYIGGYAKNGAVLLTLSGTTGQTIDLLNTAGNTPAGSIGDTVFATVSVLIFKNLGTADVTIAPGGTNPSDIPKFTGTTPTLRIPAGSTVVYHSNAPVTIDATHRNILVTPATGGSLAVSIGGA